MRKKSQRPLKRMKFDGQSLPDMEREHSSELGENDVDVSQISSVQDECFHEDGEESGIHLCPISDLIERPITSQRVMDAYKLNRYFAEPSTFMPKQMVGFTNDFNERSKIGSTQFGEVYRGKMRVGPKRYEVTIKIWNKKANCLNDSQGRPTFVKEEVMLLRDPLVSLHNNVANVIGYCDEGGVTGIVYDFKSMDSLHNMITKDGFGWTERVEVALRFARLVDYLHNLAKPYIIRNISPLHIMIDHEFNPILFDFGCVYGGIIGELNAKKKLIWNSPGYMDWNTPPELASPKSDVYAYGVILLALLSKRVHGHANNAGECIVALDDLARLEYSKNMSVVHESLKLERGYDNSNALLLTKLGIRCIEPHVHERPTMREVVDCIMNLRVVSDQIDVALDSSTESY